MTTTISSITYTTFEPLYSIDNIRAEAQRLRSIDLKFAVIPPEGGVPGKQIIVKHWPLAALEEWVAPDEIPYPSNLGVLTGTHVVRNGHTYWVVDVDVDDQKAVPIFAKFMPRTMMWGRPGKPRSHYLYFADKPVITITGAHSHKTVEIFGLSKSKGTPGHQSVVPPSVWHKNGRFEPIRYEEDSLPEPAIISAEFLTEGF